MHNSYATIKNVLIGGNNLKIKVNIYDLFNALYT